MNLHLQWDRSKPIVIIGIIRGGTHMSKEILQVNQVTARVEDKEILHGVSLDIKKHMS